MNLAALTNRSAVLSAIAEFDDLGRDAFLKKYGFKPARRYMLLHEGKLYDSKAIAGAAIGFQYPEAGALSAKDFSGGEATVKTRLERLGFEFQELEGDFTQNPDWTREETILALDILARRRPTLPDQNDREVIALSDLLRLYAAQRNVKGNANYRNPNGVSMKIDIAP